MPNTITTERGRPAVLGATLDGEGVHFAVYSENADAVEVCLFDAAGARETDRLTLSGDADGTRYGFVPGLAAGARYGLRARGPFDPKAGHRFDPSKLLVDPYAVHIDRPFVYHPSLAAPPERALDTAAFVPRAVVPDIARNARPLPFAAPGFTYELSVRAFSQRCPEMSAALRGTVGALAEPYVLDHLARLGIDTVELMPLAAWIDEGHLAPHGLVNAWGYNPVTHMAPDPRLAPGGLAEIRRAVEALHARGIRVLLDVVFNHSGEGPAEGPTLSYRGLDNRLYYDTAPGEPGVLLNHTGTGNTFAVHRPPVARMVIDGLRSWVETTGIDGFRYDLATVLGRGPEGFRPDAPFFAMLAADAVLKDRLHVAEPWDIGPGGYQVGRFPKPWMEWQDRFRDDVRRFWRGDPGMVGALATRLAGSADLYGRDGRTPASGVNFIAAHDGFTLADVTMYERKHNEANGENNRDGHNDNHSWNNGVEGKSDDPAVIEARGRDVRALVATLLVARGNPMIVAGDEFGRTQGGNNNGYAQDNAVTWLDWERADARLAAFTGALAHLRRAHPALGADAFLTGAPAGGAPVGAGQRPPDVAWLREDGRPFADADWSDGRRQFLGMALSARRGSGEEGDGAVERVLVYLNGARAQAPVRLPEPRPGHAFRLALQSDRPDLEPRRLEGADLVVTARSVFILLEEQA